MLSQDASQQFCLSLYPAKVTVLSLCCIAMTENINQVFKWDEELKI